MAALPYHIGYNTDDDSGRLGIDFDTEAEACRMIEHLKHNPAKYGYAEWLKTAILWVIDDNGDAV